MTRLSLSPYLPQCRRRWIWTRGSQGSAIGRWKCHRACRRFVQSRRSLSRLRPSLLYLVLGYAGCRDGVPHSQRKMLNDSVNGCFLTKSYGIGFNLEVLEPVRYEFFLGHGSH
jgi:hypothetical protein